MPIVAERLTHVYSPGTPMETKALEDVSMAVSDGEVVGVIGATGSGKTTLVQHFNGLLKPTSGRVLVDGRDLSGRDVNLKEIRRRVGLLFQYPEHQLFEETVFEDVAFGPKNLGLGEREVSRRVREALLMVGLRPDEVGDRSPFELSGGQMRRVAIAGVLAMRPATLILDEPTAGLDPGGRAELLDHLKRLRAERDMTVILVSHNMAEVAALCERLVVLDGGRVAASGSVSEVFSRVDLLERVGLGAPPIARLMSRLRADGMPVRTDVFTVEDAKAEIMRALQGRRGDREC